jgi:hypothetical protein
MESNFSSRFKKAWNAFFNRNEINNESYYVSGSYSKPDRVRLSRGNERSIVTSIINKIAIDVASIDINHCRVDEEDRFQEIIKDDLNTCLNFESNLDQTSRSFFQAVVMSMLNSGVVAIIPVDTSKDPNLTDSYDIYTMRTGKIVNWYPNSILVSVYNERTGQRQEITVLKKNAAIIENPLYAVMNEPNSTLQRLIRKLVLLDAIDENNSSGKLDLIIQLPYVVKSEIRKQQANERREEIERQLRGSKYGIAYTDGTEKITQLNRSVDNQLMTQIEYLTSMLYSQLGISQAVLDGTADEKVMNNYFTHTIEPIISAIVDEMSRKFLTKTARSQGQRILFFRDPFKLIPVSEMAELADKFTRNEILTSNEVRQIIGRKPSSDPKADQLVNSNISQPKDRDYGDGESINNEDSEPTYEEEPTEESSDGDISIVSAGLSKLEEENQNG